MTEDQIILVDKPAGLTSFGVVARIRARLRDEFGHKVKVGHTGTLDPFATGLLILLSGKMTKKSNDFLKLDKIYETTLRLGYVSTTGDPEGQIREYPKGSSEESVGGYDRDKRSAPPVTTGRRDSVSEEPPLDILVSTLNRFTGRITQTPPRFSAIKIDGRRAYKLARQGQDFTLPSREVTIYRIDLLDYHYPELSLRVHCSSGTYIRTLAEDIGKALGTGAYCAALRRTRIGDFDITDPRVISL